MSLLNFYSSRNRITILGCFFIFFVFEATIGGSGRLIELGDGLTLRKVNFVIALAFSAFVIFYFKNIAQHIAITVLIHSILLVVATTIGFINYGPEERVMENFLMQSFFLLLPFYHQCIRNEKDIRLISNILKFVSLFIAIVYLIVIFLMFFGFVDFIYLYNILTKSPEFMGRGETAFFYKGFLYLCLGLFFFDIEDGFIWKRIKQLIVLTAVYFTFVRGFILALFVSVFLHQLLFKSVIKGVLILAVSATLFSVLGRYYTAQSFDRSQSDLVRNLQLEQVFAEINPSSLVVGHGFGKGVAIRDNHFEINYLEILHKQGVIGLIFWIAILGYICLLYINCKRLGHEKKARPFLLAALFVYIQSATNPFLTNSIGLNMIMISIVCLNLYCKNEKSGETVLTPELETGVKLEGSK